MARNTYSAMDEMTAGDEITVEYDSAYGGRSTTSGTIADVVNVYPNASVEWVEVLVCDEDVDRRDAYKRPEAATRRVTYIDGKVDQIDAKNGARWQRISDVGHCHAEVEVTEIESDGGDVIGCLGCGFGYPAEEFDDCPTCNDEDEDDEDDGDDEDERTELTYDDRQELEAGDEATLVYDNPYSGTRVERTVTITDTGGRVTVEIEDGTEWGIFAGTIRTTVNNRRASGTTEAKNGRKVGALVDLLQDDAVDVEVVEEVEPELVADGGRDVDVGNDLLRRSLLSLDAVRSASSKRGRLGATVQVAGEIDDVPSHVFRIAKRFDLAVIHRDTGFYGRGTETVLEVAGEGRRDEIVEHYEGRDRDVEVVHDVGGDKCLEVVTDGGVDEADEVDAGFWEERVEPEIDDDSQVVVTDGGRDVDGRGDVVALVGCGSAKVDLEDGETVAIKDLYRSGYFTKKREFAEELADRWYVLSAEHGLAKPWSEVETYEKTIGDLEGKALEEWQASVALTLKRAVGPYDRVVVLGGRSYVEALERGLVRWGVDVDLVDPFAETSGIGDQNGWMADALAAGNPFHPVGEAEVATDGGQEVDPVDVAIAVECSECGAEYVVEEESAEDHVEYCPIRRAFINSGRWEDPNASDDEEPDEELVTDGGQVVEDDVEYWLGEVRAFLARDDRDLEVYAVGSPANDEEGVLVEAGELDREGRAELIHRLDRAGFETRSASDVPRIRVNADERRLEYPYSETSGVGDDDLMTDGGQVVEDVEEREAVAGEALEDVPAGETLEVEIEHPNRQGSWHVTGEVVDVDDQEPLTINVTAEAVEGLELASDRVELFAWYNEGEGRRDNVSSSFKIEVDEEDEIGSRTGRVLALEPADDGGVEEEPEPVVEDVVLAGDDLAAALEEESPVFAPGAAVEVVTNDEGRWLGEVVGLETGYRTELVLEGDDGREIGVKPPREGGDVRAVNGRDLEVREREFATVAELRVENLGEDDQEEDVDDENNGELSDDAGDDLQEDDVDVDVEIDEDCCRALVNGSQCENGLKGAGEGDLCGIHTNASGVVRVDEPEGAAAIADAEDDNDEDVVDLDLPAELAGLEHEDEVTIATREGEHYAGDVLEVGDRGFSGREEGVTALVDSPAGARNVIWLRARRDDGGEWGPIEVVEYNVMGAGEVALGDLEGVDVLGEPAVHTASGAGSIREGIEESDRLAPGAPVTITVRKGSTYVGHVRERRDGDHGRELVLEDRESDGTLVVEAGREGYDVGLAKGDEDGEPEEHVDAVAEVRVGYVGGDRDTSGGTESRGMPTDRDDEGADDVDGRDAGEIADERRRELREEGRREVLEEIAELIDAGLSVTQALDYYATASDSPYGRFSQTDWADRQGRSQQSVSRAANAGTDKIQEADGDNGE